MTEWIISADAEWYDFSSYFEHFGFIDWRQGKTRFEINDSVYIYCTRPISAIRYKCKVERVYLKHENIKDYNAYWKDINPFHKSLDAPFMRLRLVDQVAHKNLGLEALKAHGLHAAPQGPVRVRQALSEYLQVNFTDQYQSDFFPDTVQQGAVAYEGLKKQVTVNKYERSSIARDKCIQYHGLNCWVCNMNFYDSYGEIGRGFIHIHHLRPLHRIGRQYKVDYKKDLVPVCPNCHAMLHRKIGEKEPTISELKKMLKK